MNAALHTPSGVLMSTSVSTTGNSAADAPPAAAARPAAIDIATKSRRDNSIEDSSCSWGSRSSSDMACSSMNRAALIVDESKGGGPPVCTGDTEPIALPQNAGVAERVAAGLRVDAEAVRPLADGNAREQVAVSRVERVNLRVVAAGQPQHLVVCRHAAHVGTAAPWDLPFCRDLPRGYVDDRDRPLPAVRDIKPL